MFIHESFRYILVADLPECCSINVPPVLNNIYRSGAPFWQLFLS